MRSYFKVSLVAVGLAAAVAASAQPASAPGATAPAACIGANYGKQYAAGSRRAPCQAMTPEQRQSHFDSIATQQAKDLQITAAQRPLWNAYVQAKKSKFAAKPNDAQFKEFTRMNAVERAEARVRHLETATQHARQIAASTKALHDSLTPEQRTRFDQMGTHHGKHFGHGRRLGKRPYGMRHGATSISQVPAKPEAANR